MRQVNPKEAREGEFLQSFDLGNFDQMLDQCAKFEKAMERNKVRGEIVYTRIRHGRFGHDENWQIYLIRR